MDPGVDGRHVEGRPGGAGVATMDTAVGAACVRKRGRRTGWSISLEGEKRTRKITGKKKNPKASIINVPHRFTKW
jgi:hypothetical protein